MCGVLCSHSKETQNSGKHLIWVLIAWNHCKIHMFCAPAWAPLLKTKVNQRWHSKNIKKPMEKPIKPIKPKVLRTTTPKPCFQKPGCWLLVFSQVLQTGKDVRCLFCKAVQTQGKLPFLEGKQYKPEYFSYYIWVTISLLQTATTSSIIPDDKQLPILLQTATTSSTIPNCKQLPFEWQCPYYEQLPLLVQFPITSSYQFYFNSWIQAATTSVTVP